MIPASAARETATNCYVKVLEHEIGQDTVEEIQNEIISASEQGRFSWRYHPATFDLDNMELIKTWLEVLGYDVVRAYQNDQRGGLDINWGK